ncbi:MAG: hypothetical protein KJO07_01215 [Deltaproteobacteria bacterium]|nr:hypothetical protein [Deltaproteobacteria bacterium]
MRDSSTGMHTALVLGLAALLAGCGDKKEGGESPAPGSGQPATAVDPGAASPGAAPGDERLPPPKDAFVGQERLVNLHLGKDGTSKTVDVWATGSARYLPVLLAEKIELGQASDWFGVPKGDRVLVVETGKKSTDQPLASLQRPKDGDHITSILFAATGGDFSVRPHYETHADGRVDEFQGPPAAGKGFATVLSLPLGLHKQTIEAAFGAKKFHLGMGKGECPPQRVPDGQTGQLIGGSSAAYLELAPGKNKMTLHKWPARVTCESEPVFEFEIEVKADASTLVFLYTPDGKTLKVLQLDRTPPSAGK